MTHQHHIRGAHVACRILQFGLLLLLLSGNLQAVAAELKADYGFVPRSVTRHDLGLGEREVFVMHLSDNKYWGEPPDGKLDPSWPFDEFMLKQAIEGMLNRHGALVWLDDFSFMNSMCKGPREWPRYYGETRGLTFLEPERDLGRILQRVAPVFNGIILYDAEPSQNIFAALNLANLNFCLPVSRRIYNAYPDSLKDLKVVATIDAQHGSYLETWTWLIDHVLPRTNNTLAFSVGAPFGDHVRVNEKADAAADAKNAAEIARYRIGNSIGIDYAFFTKCFIVNLTCSSVPTDCYGWYQTGSVEEARLFERVLTKLVRPAPLFGWTVDVEPVYCTGLAKFGHYIDGSGASPNLSFHATIPPLSPPPFIQEDCPRLDRPESKCYIAFTANEGDAVKTRVRMYHEAWLSPQRGKVPLNWDINPDNARRFPSMVEYYWRTRTANDYFIAGPSGAGYADLPANPYLNEYLHHVNATLAYMNLREVEFWYPSRTVLERFSELVPSMRGMTITPPQGGLATADMYFTQKGNIPVYRYADIQQYWFLKKPFQTTDPAWFDRNTHSIDPDALVAWVEDVASKAKGGPSFAIFYGIETNLLDSIVEFDAKLDKARFQIVDLGTFMHLLKQTPATLTSGSAMSEQGKVTWQPEMLRTAQAFDQRINDAELTFSDAGLFERVAPEKTWASAGISSMRVPAGATAVRLRVEQLGGGGKWIFKLIGDLEGYGDQTAWFFGDSDQPGEIIQPLDPRIIRQPDMPLRLELGVIGPAGASVLISDLEFTN